MESTASDPVVSVSPASLAAAFAQMTDPRRAASVIYPLPAILSLAVAAILANQLSVLAIAEWGARQAPEVLTALGFPVGRTPCQSTLQRLFRQLDGNALATVLTTAVTPCAGPPPAPASAPAAPQGVAIDGKAQRGRLRFSGRGCPVHALSAFCHDPGVVLAHEPLNEPVTTDRGEAELTVAPALLDRIDWHDRVLTGDALFCQRSLCQQVGDAGGDYLLTVKENQGTLYRDIQFLFDPPAAFVADPLTDRRVASTLEYGHGRQRERRELIASTDLIAYLTWPGLAQVFRVERTWTEHEQRKAAVHYGITSLSPAQAGAARLLALRRGHWAIENRLHRRKDVNFGEDASLIHVGQGPTVMALLRDAAVTVLHLAGVRQVAARLRRHSQYPAEALALVVQPLPTGA
jgi:predicted transposase YbfD/YdcC